MRYEIFTDLGGFLWWLFIKFGKTDLRNEQTQKKWSRNLFFLILVGLIIAFVVLKLI
jgi:hypothetical protein